MHSSKGDRLVRVVLDLCEVGLLLSVSRLCEGDTGGSQVCTFHVGMSSVLSTWNPGIALTS